MLRGKFEYQASGLLDRGHLRFFTARSIASLMADAGLTIRHQSGLWHRTTVRRLLMTVSLGRVEPFLVRQYLVVAERDAAPMSKAA